MEKKGIDNYMAYHDNSLFNTRDYCREQILKYLDFYKKDNYEEIGASFINSVAKFVSKVVDDAHGPHYFCDEIDVEILFNKYVEYKSLELCEYSEDFKNMLIGYMARRLQNKINEFYKLLRNGKYSVQVDNTLSKKDKDLFIKKINNLYEESPKIIRKK